MRPGVHLHPERLRAHAAEAHEIAEVLRSTAIRRPLTPDVDGLDITLRRAVGELTELGAVLAAAAAAAIAVDSDIARALRQVEGP